MYKIILEVNGGLVDLMSDLPPGLHLEIRDYDVDSYTEPELEEGEEYHSSSHSGDKHPKQITATLNESARQVGFPTEFTFNTYVQEKVERAMLDMGYGCRDYRLSYSYVMPEGD